MLPIDDRRLKYCKYAASDSRAELRLKGCVADEDL